MMILSAIVIVCYLVIGFMIVEEAIQERRDKYTLVYTPIWSWLLAWIFSPFIMLIVLAEVLFCRR